MSDHARSYYVAVPSASPAAHLHLLPVNAALARTAHQPAQRAALLKDLAELPPQHLVAQEALRHQRVQEALVRVLRFRKVLRETAGRT
jgi:hypothetical protein